MQFHLSLNVSDIDASVAFYEKVFGPPVKHRPDYAKFEVADPPLVLSLEPTPPAGSGALNHVGLRLSDTETLVEMQRRLEMAGLKSEREVGVECCYAKQTKFWLHSPDGVLWEFYVLQGDIAHRGAGQVPEKVVPSRCSAAAGESAESAKASWEHRLSEPIPETLPFDDGSVSEVRLRGSFNAPEGEARRDEILAEVRRVLTPGGRVALHILTANRPLSTSLSLPGPAAAVKAVPTDDALLASLEAAGFVNGRLTKFGTGPCFRIGECELRETMVEAFAPAPADDAETVVVVYRGPFREVTDDAGRRFRRGERVRLPAAQWQRLSPALLSDAFTCLAEPEVMPVGCG